MCNSEVWSSKEVTRDMISLVTKSGLKDDKCKNIRKNHST